MTTATLGSTVINPPGTTPVGSGATGIPAGSAPGNTTRGLCTLSWGNTTFRFRTNPNEIWWSYELLTNIENTYGGRVVQLLGTRLGDLSVKVDCGGGGWTYLIQVVLFLRNLLSDQRNGNTATFGYTTRNWQLGVYSMSIPFADQVTATTREIELNFKIQQDITGVMSSISMDAELLRLQDGVYAPGAPIHNQYNDPLGVVGNVAAALQLPGQINDPLNPSGPSYLASGISNQVDTNITGGWPANDLTGGAIPGLGNFGSLFSLFGGLI